MIYNDYWTEGISEKHQNLIIEYVENSCRLFPGIAGYKRIAAARAFLRSKKGRIAKRRYVEYLCDMTKDEVKLKVLPIWLARAFYDPADIVTDQGELNIPAGEEHRGLRALGINTFCIDGIEVSEQKVGRNTKIKLCDREKALEVIAKLFDLYTKDDNSDNGVKSVYEMTDQERDEEIQRLAKKGGFDITPDPKEVLKKIEFKEKESEGNEG